MKMQQLPSTETQRWVIRKKALVVAAIRNGILSFNEARERYRLSEEELNSWIQLLDRHGIRGLRTTRMQEYRPAELRHEGVAA